MIPILSSEQIRLADQATIRNEPIASIDLMERASIAFTNKFCHYYNDSVTVGIVSGLGNNGGDGMAIARLLEERSYKVETYVVGNPDKGTPDFKANYDRLDQKPMPLGSSADLKKISGLDVVIDGIFGSGLTRPVTGFYGEVIDFFNESANDIVAIDIASGLFSDQPLSGEGSVIKPSRTISFQLPKLAFFQPELVDYVGEWDIVSIGLDKEFIDDQETDYYFLEAVDVKKLLPSRRKFSHKGDFGRIQIVSGSKGKMGAAAMAGKAAMRSGSGLLFVQSPGCGVEVIHRYVVEGMVLEDPHKDQISEIMTEPGMDAIGIGPGIGTSDITRKAFTKFMEQECDTTLVLDADALNILSENPELFKTLPEETILTPHPGEFRRMAGQWSNDFQKVELLRSFCKKYKVNVVLKGAYSSLCNKKGKVTFNATGNPGMATGGSGDVLFGIITSLAGQGLPCEDALKLAVFVHGLAGDMAAKRLGEQSLIATDIINFLPEAFSSISA